MMPGRAKNFGGSPACPGSPSRRRSSTEKSSTRTGGRWEASRSSRPRPQPLPRPSRVIDANGDKKLSAEEFASEPRIQKTFYTIDLDSDGTVDERDWNFYRARRASRNALHRGAPWRSGRLDRERQRSMEPAEVSSQRSIAAALPRSVVSDQRQRDFHQP